MSALSTALFLFRDIRSTLGVDRWFGGPDKGSLVVNINTTTASGLESLPGIGTPMAARIIARRPYSKVEGLERVLGIGPKQIETHQECKNHLSILLDLTAGFRLVPRAAIRLLGEGRARGR